MRRIKAPIALSAHIDALILIGALSAARAAYSWRVRAQVRARAPTGLDQYLTYIATDLAELINELVLGREKIGTFLYSIKNIRIRKSVRALTGGKRRF